MKEKWKQFQRVQYLSTTVGVAAILLPIIFWKHIPNRIPHHFDGAGVADAWSDKTSLILIFFCIFMLLGVMGIVTYYLKSSGLSKNASESEKKNLRVFYPAIAIMNLVIQLMFAYMVFCSVTCRNLGKLFLPIALIGTFLPLIWCCFKEYKNSVPTREAKRAYAEQEKAKKEAGVVYRTKIDLWLAVLILVPLGTEIKLIAGSLREGKTDWLSIIVTLFIVGIFAPLVAIRYTLYEDYLLVDCRLFGKERIPYESITKMKKTYNPLASAALSIKRIQIDYTIKGSHDMVLISPVNRDAFLKEVEKRRQLYYNRTHHE